jgi:hypothetical protein
MTSRNTGKWWETVVSGTSYYSGVNSHELFSKSSDSCDRIKSREDRWNDLIKKYVNP